MADETKPAATGTENGTAPVPPKMQVVAQFIRDMSFENLLSQKGLVANEVPEIGVQVSLDAKKRQTENQYEVTSKYTVTAKKPGGGDTLFLLELQYTGIFLIENVPDEQMHPFLLIECPRMLFPFARRIIHDVVRDGGFPPMNLDTIDWIALYRQNALRAAEAAKAASETKQ